MKPTCSILCCLVLIVSSLPVEAKAKKAGKTEKRITEGFDPAVSPDGRWLAFARGSRGNVDVWISRIDGSDERRMTEHPGQDKNPCWSPDGRQLVFVSGRSGNGDLYVMSVDGSEPMRRLTAEPGREDDPDWSSNGEMIAFTLLGDRSSTIGIVPRDGGAVTVFDPHPDAWESDPAFSADGRWLALVTDVNFDSDLAIFPMDTQERWDARAAEGRVVEHRPGNERSPSWHPQRNLLVYIGEDPLSPAFGAYRAESEPLAMVSVVAVLSEGLDERTATLTKMDMDTDEPVWTPDGTSVVYTKLGDVASNGDRGPHKPEIWLRTGVLASASP